MLAEGAAVKVTVHLNEDTSANSDFLHKEILSFLYDQGVSGASLLKLQSGFGSHHHLHTEGAGWDAGEHLPIRIEFIEEPERAAKILPQLCALVTDGMVEVQDTRILKNSTAKKAGGPKV
jgi:PII-like signaling protein